MPRPDTSPPSRGVQPTTERRIDHDSIAIATQTFGNPEDPAMLLIMGATASMLGWPDGFCTALASHGLHVIRYDHRDTGGTTTVPPGQADYTVEGLAADAFAVLDGYGIDRAHLTGMSLGGYIAQIAALTHPDRVASLTLIASEPLGWDGAPLPHISEKFLAHFAALETLDWSNRSAVADFLIESERLCAGPSAQFDHARVAETVDRVLSRTDSPASMFNHGTLTTRHDWTGRFRDIACPVLVLHGDADPILPPENGRAIASGISGAALAVLPGVGHELPPRIIPDMTVRIAAHAAAPRERDP